MLKGFIYFSLIYILQIFFGMSHSSAETLDTRWQNALKSFYKKHPQKLSLDYSQNYFYAPDPQGKSLFANRQLSQIGFTYQGESRGKNLKADISYFYSASEDKHYVNLVDAYYTKKWSRVDLSVGRKLENWSYADQTWSMGLWQPRFMWSRLRPVQNGLSGVFLAGSVKNFQWTTFASPISLPEMGPQFVYNEQQFSSANPWFRPPARYATVPGLFKSDKIIYNYESPEIDRIIFHPSLAGQLKWLKNNYFCQVNFAYKPMSQLVTSVYPYLDNSPPGNSRPEVDVYPFVADHRLVGGECGRQQTKGWHGYISVNHESPVRENRPENWVVKRTLETSMLTTLLGYQRGHTNIFFSLMNLWGGDDQDSGRLASPTKSFFEQRYDYYRALKLGVTQKVSSLMWDVDVIWDFEQEAWSWLSEVSYEFKNSLKTFIQVDGIAL
ncbi:MAG: hypothetical protein KDD40_09680, partial [Bdellovibrionales bacterium]|nr:hypothetical protein [Bdellovibrionales bacterium]